MRVMEGRLNKVRLVEKCTQGVTRLAHSVRRRQVAQYRRGCCGEKISERGCEDATWLRLYAYLRVAIKLSIVLTRVEG